MGQYKIDLARLDEIIPELRAGDAVILSGTVYTARDAAHKRIKEIIENSGELPFELKGAVIYYAGPTPAPEGRIIGSCGPTTSGRMDPYTAQLLDMGLKAMIGKGERSQEVIDAIVRNRAVYFTAIGGAGAFYSDCIKELEVIAFDDLGCESVKKLRVEGFMAVTAIDAYGGNIYRTGRETYAV